MPRRWREVREQLVPLTQQRVATLRVGTASTEAEGAAASPAPA
jgi:hypothetical protein